MIKLIAMDMDGTLLNSESKLSDKTVEALINVQQRGIRLVLASGRSYAKLLPYAKELRMDEFGGWLVEINGMAIYDVQQENRTVLAQMSVEQVHEIFRYFAQYHVEIIANLDEGMYDYIPPAMMKEKVAYRNAHQIPDDVPWTAGAFTFIYDNRKGYPNLHYVRRAEDIQESVNKISVAYHSEALQKVAKKAKEDLKDKYWLGLTSPSWLEIMIPGVTKATGLAHIGEQLDIAMDEILAFGDGENDLEMLQEAGIGIAMGNAFDEVKEIADAVTLSNDEDGIVLMLEKYLKDEHLSE